MQSSQFSSKNDTDAITATTQGIVLAKWQQILLVITVVTLVFIGFYSVSLDNGYDWRIIRNGVLRLTQGQSPLGYDSGFYGPPWLALALFPIAILPFKVSLALLNTLTLLGVMAFAIRYHLGALKTILLLTSPPIIFTLWLGQLDVLILLVLFLPVQWWFLGALAKPQAAFGIIGKLLHQRRAWLPTLLWMVVIISATFFIWGWWVEFILNRASSQNQANDVHNVLRGFWPFQLVVGVGLLSIAYERNDERLYMASSPFLFSYAASYSYFAPFLAALSMLRRWQSMLIWLVWWGAYFSRTL